jgi:diaminopimelate decarboxylase
MSRMFQRWPSKITPSPGPMARLMPGTPVHYSGDELFCESIPLSEIAAKLGTPIYVYSQATLLDRVRQYKQAAAGLPIPSLICYALKANGNPHLLRLMVAEGLGADVTSGGELFLALHAGFPAERVVFSGVGKGRSEIESALQAGIKALHVESEAELELIAEVAAESQSTAPVTIRINPDVAAPTHPGIRTGMADNKFGVSPDVAVRLVRRALANPSLQVVGLAAHIGSQISDLTPYRDACQALSELALGLMAEGVQFEYLDVGGGLAVDYANAAPDPASWVATVSGPVADAGLALVMEPGRSIIGPAGLLLVSVLYAKNQAGKHFLVVDAGMTDLIRPALYDAYHPIWPVLRRRAVGPKAPVHVDVVGPICETTDTLGRDRPLGHCQMGDLLAIMQAGAYGYAMSSNYNGRLRPAEVLVSEESLTIIRRRQNVDSLLDGT